MIYPVIAVDGDGKLLSGSNNYNIRSRVNDLPPAKFFWSLTMYGFPSRLLVANPIDRYLLNTPMMPNWVKDADGGYTYFIQNEAPGKDKQANWLPAPKDGFYLVMRLYGPSEAAQDGIWKASHPIRAAREAGIRRAANGTGTGLFQRVVQPTQNPSSMLGTLLARFSALVAKAMSAASRERPSASWSSQKSAPAPSGTRPSALS